METLAGKSAIVTGGSRGIGRAIVERLTREGARVVFSYRDDEAAAEQVRAVVADAGGYAHPVRADQGDLNDLQRLFDVAARHIDGLDILVINAATNPTQLIDEATEDEYDRTMAVNAKGPYFAIQHAGRTMRDGGRIITISTLNTELVGPRLSLYAASKAALELFTTVAAHELGSRGITANAVLPGATDTAMLYRANSPESLKALVGITPLGRLGQPADIADVVAFLAGPDSRWITGQRLRAAGGLVL